VHPLTKIFIVLVALLAVALVPLVAVYATNEGTYKRKWMDEQAKAAASAADLQKGQSAWNATEASLNEKLGQLQAQITSLKEEADRKSADNRKLASDLAAAKALQASINSNLEIMAQTGKANSALNEALVIELRDLRTKVVDAERQVVELDEQVSTLQSQLDVADAARKALQAELTRVGEEKNMALSDVAKYVATYGQLANDGIVTAAAGMVGDRVPADRDVAATIVAVRNVNDQTLAEINAGSRDGIKEGWTMTIANGPNFVGLLRIMSVDVNRATGVVELAAVAGNGPAQVGQKAIARRGE
jgi:chromosome segregation ATPase